MKNLFLMVFSTACSPAFTSVKTFDSENTGEDEGDIFGLSGLPDLEESMVTDHCEDEQPGAAGATTYFLGTYIEDSDGWIGKERWILHPTSGWTSTGGETCYVTWEVNAQEIDVVGCPTCSLALSVSAFVNRQETDCPDGLWDNPQEEQWEAVYNIEINDDQAIFSFQGTDSFLGEGYANASAVSFLSNVSCSWF
tara:strand:+ start:81 stop:665 length:585 start_codon:yes stop_codon:yes gene_type:complete